MVRLLAATLLLSVVLHSTGSDLCADRTGRHRRRCRGAKILQSDLPRSGRPRISGGDAGREVVSRSHHDRIF